MNTYKYEHKSNPEASDNVTVLLLPSMASISVFQVPGGYDNYIFESVRRFSIPYKDVSIYQSLCVKHANPGWEKKNILLRRIMETFAFDL